jgi:hypothetical protein
MYWTFVGDLKQSLPLLLRELTDESNLDLNSVDQRILANTFSGVIRVHLSVRQVDANAPKRPTLAGRVHAQCDRFAGSQRGQKELIRTRPAILASGTGGFICLKGMSTGRDLLQERG